MKFEIEPIRGTKIGDRLILLIMVFRISINSLGHKIRNDEELVLNVKLNC
jgi:hypothetical protein